MKRNVVAKALSSSLYRKRVVLSKKTYNRKKKEKLIGDKY